MKNATISQTKNRLSAYLDLVRRGETVLILDRDKPVAYLVPAGTGAGGEDARLAELERLGILRRPAQRPLRKLPPPLELPGGAGLLDALLAEREEAPY